MASKKIPLIAVVSDNLSRLLASHGAAINPLFSEVAIGQSYEAFASQLANSDECVICCDMTVKGAKDVLVDILSKSPRSKPVWIHSFSAGVDYMAHPAIRSVTCPITNAKGCFSRSLAEYALTACLHFNKQIPRLQANKANKVYDRFPMGELYGQTMGVIGYGDIGSKCAKLAAAFEMKILGWRRSEQPSDGVAEMHYGVEGMKKVLQESDYVVAALPGTPATHHIMSTETFRNMKSTAVFINIGRGVTVDEAALIEAMKKNQLHGAALDVFEVEPLPESSELWTLDNVLLSPHNADLVPTYWEDSMLRFKKLASDHWAKGVDFDYLVNLEAGY